MAKDFMGLKWKSAIDALLNEHIVKVASKYLCLHHFLILGQRRFFFKWSVDNSEIHNGFSC